MSNSSIEKIRSKLNSLETRIEMFHKEHSFEDINRLRKLFIQYKRLKDPVSKELFITSNNLSLEMCHAASATYMKHFRLLKTKDNLISKLNGFSTNEKTRQYENKI